MNFAEAQEMLVSIEPGNTIEEYLSAVYAIYFGSIDENGRIAVSEDNKEILREIVVLSTDEYGLGVHIAMALLDTVIHTNVDFDEEEKLATFGNNLISVYPNPAYDKVSLLGNISDKNGFEIQILDFTGKEVLRLDRVHYSTPISLQNLEDGIYLMSVTQNDNVIYIGKLILTHTNK